MYNFSDIEKKEQKKWRDSKIFETDLSSDKPKYYVLEMLPYPSGALHMGHVRNYTIGDSLARYRRMRGFDVVYPFGWDSFGLPAEQAAIKRGTSPAIWTDKNIAQMKEQLSHLGLSYDWNREIKTSDISYYKWNQWIFKKMFEKGLAYKKRSFVNWSESLQTVLANEQVENAFCSSGKSDIVQKELDQWFFKITEYAEELVESLKDIDWPENVKAQQEKWIGIKDGTEVEFDLPGYDSLKIYTTRLDTIYGVSYVAIAKEHAFVEELKKDVDRKDQIEEFIKTAPLTKEEKLNNLSRGIFTGHYAVNPVNGERIPLYIADYVIGYGTGAVMGVPAHDERDFNFAKEHKLKVKEVVKAIDGESELPFVDKGVLVDSKDLTSLKSDEAIDKMISKGLATKKRNYRLRDWLISRQRYWGTPIPVIYENGEPKISELPVKLPEDIDFSANGNPIESSKEFFKEFQRETDTMDTFVDSSWYYLRYLDSQNSEEIFSKEVVDKIPQVDIYIGGIEHAVMHLLYARFIHKVLADLGIVKSREPFKKLLTQGMVLSNSYYLKSENRYLFPHEVDKYSSDDIEVTMEKMSKSKNNGVVPEEMIEKYGADSVRLFILFAAPPTKDLEWNERGISGMKRFVNRVHDIFIDNLEDIKSRKEPKVESEDDKKALHELNTSILKAKEVMEDNFHFNVTIAHLMSLLNLCYDVNLSKDVQAHILVNIVKMLSPFAPHISEYLWSLIDSDSIINSSFPEADKEHLSLDVIEIPIQVNGRVRGKISINRDDEESKVLDRAKEEVSKYLTFEIKKSLYIKGKIVNFVG